VGSQGGSTGSGVRNHLRRLPRGARAVVAHGSCRHS
jgi:hypothetical protein